MLKIQDFGHFVGKFFIGKGFLNLLSILLHISYKILEVIFEFLIGFIWNFFRMFYLQNQDGSAPEVGSPETVGFQKARK